MRQLTWQQQKKHHLIIKRIWNYTKNGRKWFVPLVFTVCSPVLAINIIILLDMFLAFLWPKGIVFWISSLSASLLMFGVAAPRFWWYTLALFSCQRTMSSQCAQLTIFSMLGKMFKHPDANQWYTFHVLKVAWKSGQKLSISQEQSYLQ